MVLVNTYKGKSTWDEIEDIVYYEKRSLDEATKEQVTLQHPTSRPKERQAFLEQYVTTHDFEESVANAYDKYFSKEFVTVARRHRAKTSIKNYIKRAIGFKNSRKIMELKHKIKGDRNVGK